jgi:hypothetical protein
MARTGPVGKAARAVGSAYADVRSVQPQYTPEQVATDTIALFGSRAPTLCALTCALIKEATGQDRLHLSSVDYDLWMKIISEELRKNGVPEHLTK